MRNAAFILLFVASGYVAKSQRFSLLPQVGFENSKTKISYNDLSSFAPEGVKFTPQASLRLNYSSKKGHGFFLGTATSRSIVSFSFTDPETLSNTYSATAGSLQLRMEGGYQFNSKPITLGKSKQASANNTAKKNCSSAKTEKRSCGSSSSRSSNKTKENSVSKNSSSWVRIQPSLGMGYIPFVKDDVITKSEGGQAVYQYNAGNWRTALIAGTGFEFGKGNTSKVTVSVNYFKGVGNLDEQTITSVSGGKTVTTTLESVSSGWNVRVGVPFALKAKPKTAKTKKTENRKSSGCGQYRMIYRCRN
ncbi:MAG: hypothetical protein ACHQFX_04915 [Chitinophagales bacterium]